MSHSWVSRANALATYAGTVLAVVCLAVTATGAAVASRLACRSAPFAVPAGLAILPSLPPFLTEPPNALADYFHKSAPVVHCDFVGTEGLQKEFGHDRVRATLSCGSVPHWHGRKLSQHTCTAAGTACSFQFSDQNVLISLPCRPTSCST